MSAPTVATGESRGRSASRQEEPPAGAFARLRDPYCILVWKFSVDDDHAERFIELCDQSAELVREQPKCLFQRLRRDRQEFHVHVGLEDSYGVLTHVVTFSDMLKRSAAMARFCGLEIYGSGPELALLRDPLAPFSPLFIEHDDAVPI